MTGVVLEKNFTIGDIVDTNLDMFKIADLSRLGVMANVYEEDLPKLVALPPHQRQWRLDLMAEAGMPARKGVFESIGNVIDPTQHTAIVKGWLDNSDGAMRVGQFVTATIDLPNRPGLVSVPVSSIIDDGSRSFLFVATDQQRTTLLLREVKIVRRGAVMVQLETQPPADAGGEAQPQPIEVGELVVNSGAIELYGALNTLETQRPAIAAQTEKAQTENHR
jgi:cobalt-zinc-cadmium efflux system membrane fusion protein